MLNDTFELNETFNETFPVREEVNPDMTECPIHGEVEVTGYGRTLGSDPYAIEHAACGHDLVCYGPGDPMTIIGGRN